MTGEPEPIAVEIEPETKPSRKKRGLEVVNCTRRLKVLPLADGRGLHLAPKGHAPISRTDLSPALERAAERGIVRLV